MTRSELILCLNYRCEGGLVFEERLKDLIPDQMLELLDRCSHQLRLKATYKDAKRKQTKQVEIFMKKIRVGEMIYNPRWRFETDSPCFPTVLFSVCLSIPPNINADD